MSCLNEIGVVSDRSARLDCGPTLAEAAWRTVRRRMLLEGCKWDSQVGDVCTLASFPLLISRRQWRALAGLAESLSRELFEAESRLIGRPELIGRLGLPRRLSALYGSPNPRPPTPAAARVLRYDFHPTADGWRLSEVNSDVPGGFTEASGFSALMADASGAGTPAGDPAEAWAEAVAAAVRRPGSPGACVALLSAPGYMEDQQIVSLLVRLLGARGVEAHLAGPGQVLWHEGRARLESAWRQCALGAIIRFYQGEWLAALPPRQWARLISGGFTPVGNPGVAILSESKRFPLLWDDLGLPMPTWRAVLPEVADVGELRGANAGDWVLKRAFCNTGDSVYAPDPNGGGAWLRALAESARRPADWVAQRRFVSRPVSTPIGPVHACLGVHVIEGRACGLYGRISPNPVMDFEAIDAAVLVTGEG